MNRISGNKSTEVTTRQKPETAQAIVFDREALQALPTKLKDLVKSLIKLDQDSSHREKLIRDFAQDNNAVLDDFGELFYQGYNLDLKLQNENDAQAQGYKLLSDKKLKLESFANPIAHFLFPNCDKSFFLKKYTGISSNQKPDDLDGANDDEAAITRLYGDMQNLSRNSLSHPVLEASPQNFLSYANGRFFISNPEALVKTKEPINLKSIETLKNLLTT